ncbi:hypothetical protein SOJ65_24530 [Pseudomonas aeruginosa]|uniref:hypothetical protein n=1 Tax=Pseudomonas aeruginosa TaxID=287 RepID=UPI002A6B2E79|nr:hypothetical protein [Pseudomonas aeruginosa]MDY1054251.1 hypothetical protein [Pseudomonas aeruginosa]HCG0885753.1 hypothetical protein [Pseudomonas aeruginosa]
MNRDHPTASVEVYRLPIDRSRPLLKSATASVIRSAQVYLQQSFDTLLAADQRLAAWVRKMQELELQAVVFGGWARDRVVEMICDRDCPSRDIDFVAHGSLSVAEILPKDAVLNPFGGFGAQATCMHVDAWNLKDTFLIRRNGLPATFEALPLTADYTVNALVFKPAQFFQQSELIDCGAVNAIQTSVLEFAADEVAQPRVQAARAIILAARLQLDLSPTVRSFVKWVCECQDAREAVTHGIRTYCPALWMRTAMLLLATTMKEEC